MILLLNPSSLIVKLEHYTSNKKRQVLQGVTKAPVDSKISKRHVLL